MSLSIADKLKKYIRKNGGSPGGAMNIAELIDKLPDGGGSGSSSNTVFVTEASAPDEQYIAGRISDYTCQELYDLISSGKTAYVVVSEPMAPSDYFNDDITGIAFNVEITNIGAYSSSAYDGVMYYEFFGVNTLYFATSSDVGTAGYNPYYKWGGFGSEAPVRANM